MTADPRDGFYLTRLVEETLNEEGTVWFAEHPDLVGCNATGSTQDEALANLERSRDAWLAWAEERHDFAIPEPREDPCVQVVYALRRDVEVAKDEGADIGSQASYDVPVPA